MQLKILSWNIWIEGKFEEYKTLIERVDPDIIGLQEVKDTDPERDVIGYLSSRGYHHIFLPARKKWGDNTFNDGPALFSKLPILSSETYLLSKENARGAVRIDLQVGEKVLRVFSVHTLHTHQEHSDVQMEQIENLLSALPAENTLVMGDFNATPDSEAIRCMKSVLVDSDPDSLPTWSVYPDGCKTCNPQVVDTKLDYIFTTKDIKTHSFKVEESKGSDHLPISVIAEL
mgnify:CR=1 FL=1